MWPWMSPTRPRSSAPLRRCWPRGPHRRARALRRHQPCRLLRGHHRRGGQRSLRHQLLRRGPRRARRAAADARSVGRQDHRHRLDRRPDRPALHRPLQRQQVRPRRAGRGSAHGGQAVRHRGQPSCIPATSTPGSSPTRSFCAKAYDDQSAYAVVCRSIVELYDLNVQPGAGPRRGGAQGRPPAVAPAAAGALAARLADRDLARMAEVGHLRRGLRGTCSASPTSSERPGRRPQHWSSSSLVARTVVRISSGGVLRRHEVAAAARH